MDHGEQLMLYNMSNNIASAVPQVGSGEHRIYADFTLFPIDPRLKYNMSVR